MRTFRRLVVTSMSAGLLTGLSVVAAAPAQAITGIGNGSFETPVVTPGTFQNLGAGASIGAWTVSQGHVDLIGAGFWQAADGVQSVDLDGSSAPLTGGVAQTFTTVPLLKYRVIYRLAGNPAQGPTVKTGEVVANGGVIQSFSFDITGKSFTNMGYVHKEAHFVATGLSSTLVFRSTTGSGFGPVIDDVDVESCLLVICLG
ncbi:MAG TPA: choice-of-anchor C family protein [Actinophytocola sp.]|uniref:choice-of-anchor C family protein n=1 Tax=Actinophytocola sp. TaxID=1872138 RepID=UPI002DF917BE|nr:choice-of-anchor C family protein [Actinophytocola sp.]